MHENWIVPCNVKYYDVVNHLNNNDTIVWRKVSSLEKGDIVYLYLSAPYKEIKYRCHIIDDNVDDITLKENEYAIKKSIESHRYKYFKLQLDYIYPEKALSLEALRRHGLSQTQIQARTNRRLQAYIDAINKILKVL